MQLVLTVILNSVPIISSPFPGAFKLFILLFFCLFCYRCCFVMRTSVRIVNTLSIPIPLDLPIGKLFLLEVAEKQF
jgi:hypothetical protein